MLNFRAPRVNSHLSRRHGKDQPALPGVHGGYFEDVTQKSAIGFRVTAVEKQMRSEKHEQIVRRLWASQTGTSAPHGLADPYELIVMKFAVEATGRYTKEVRLCLTERRMQPAASQAASVYHEANPVAASRHVAHS
jgi:hypothetical protein